MICTHNPSKHKNSIFCKNAVDLFISDKNGIIFLIEKCPSEVYAYSSKYQVASADTKNKNWFHLLRNTYILVLYSYISRMNSKYHTSLHDQLYRPIHDCFNISLQQVFAYLMLLFYNNQYNFCKDLRYIFNHSI